MVYLIIAVTLCYLLSILIYYKCLQKIHSSGIVCDCEVSFMEWALMLLPLGNTVAILSLGVVIILNYFYIE